LKNKYILILISSCLILLFIGCAKQEIKPIIKPFESITIDLAKSVEFSNYVLQSENKESGRIKIVTEKKDMESIVSYIKTIDCTESTRKIKDADYEIRLKDDMGDYIYSIGVSKNQIYMYQGGINSTTLVYDYNDTKVIKELIRVYKAMDYSEEFIYSK
jgi:hypothetical protein